MEQRDEHIAALTKLVEEILTIDGAKYPARTQEVLAQVKKAKYPRLLAYVEFDKVIFYGTNPEVEDTREFTKQIAGTLRGLAPMYTQGWERGRNAR